MIELRMASVALALAATLPALPVAAFAAEEAASATAACDPVGGIEPVCGQRGPEDLVTIEGTPWVIASSLEGNGLVLIDNDSRAIRVISSFDGRASRHDRERFGDCPGPLAPTTQAPFKSHGLSIRQTGDGSHELMVVGHGLREAIEVFSIDTNADTPILVWRGCVPAPGKADLNSLTAFPDGSFYTTSFMDRQSSQEDMLAVIASDEPFGGLWHWAPGEGWTSIDIGPVAGPNGIDLSPDGKWLFVALWGDHALMRLGLDPDDAQRATVALGFQPDNIRFASEGSLYVAGQGEGTSNVARVDPATLVVSRILERKDDSHFGHATIAIPVDDELWLGSYQGNRIAIVRESQGD